MIDVIYEKLRFYFKSGHYENGDKAQLRSFFAKGNSINRLEIAECGSQLLEMQIGC